jgi:hypothetical protein
MKIAHFSLSGGGLGNGSIVSRGDLEREFRLIKLKYLGHRCAFILSNYHVFYTVHPKHSVQPTNGPRNGLLSPTRIASSLHSYSPLLCSNGALPWLLGDFRRPVHLYIPFKSNMPMATFWGLNLQSQPHSSTNIHLSIQL